MKQQQRLRVATFGGLRISDLSGAAICLRTDRARALSLFLLMHRGHLVHRETICAALWPGLGERQARAQLSKTLWRLRSALDEAGDPDSAAVVTHADCLIGLDCEQVDADCWRLADAVGAIEFTADAAMTLDEARLLAEAVRDCQGTFCVGLFDDWCAEHRETNAQLLLDAMDRLIRFHQNQQNWSQAVSWARQAVALDPLREDMHYAIMSSYRSMGNTASAIRQYNQYKRVLASELDVAPSGRLRSLFADLACCDG
jgi:DNA-binding SARP family transcriptional activator